MGPNCAVFLILLPETSQTVNIKMGILVQAGADDLQATTDYINLAHEFNAEDRAMLEAMQRNRTKHRPVSSLAQNLSKGLSGILRDMWRVIFRRQLRDKKTCEYLDCGRRTSRSCDECASWQTGC